jgi:hypothetical protein
MRTVRLAILGLALAAPAQMAQSQAVSAPSAVVVVNFTNPALSPSNWTLTLHRDGSAYFRSAHGDVPPGGLQQMDAPDVDRTVQLSAPFVARVFQTAQRHHWFNENCESHLKVAFQGWKKLSYTGPEGQGTCTFNYSQDKEIQALGDSLVGVAETLREGARLELLLQHDRLGLDKEMEYIADAAKEGRMNQICAIRQILERLAADDEVMDRVRKRARNLLAQAGT